MSNDYRKGIDDLLDLFKDNLLSTDIISAHLLAKISSEITNERINRNMNQKEFSEFLGVSQSMVSKWESSDYNFSIKSLVCIANKLDMEVDIKLKHTKKNIDTQSPKVKVLENNDFNDFFS